MAAVVLSASNRANRAVGRPHGIPPPHELRPRSPVPPRDHLERAGRQFPVQERAVVNRKRCVYLVRDHVEVRRGVFPDAQFDTETPGDRDKGPCVVERSVERDGVAARQELIKDERDVVERLTLNETAINLLLEVERTLLRTWTSELQAYRRRRLADLSEIKHSAVAHGLHASNRRAIARPSLMSDWSLLLRAWIEAFMVDAPKAARCRCLRSVPYRTVYIPQLIS
jgi:hypothetical protein